MLWGGSRTAVDVRGVQRAEVVQTARRLRDVARVEVLGHQRVWTGHAKHASADGAAAAAEAAAAAAAGLRAACREVAAVGCSPILGLISESGTQRLTNSSGSQPLAVAGPTYWVLNRSRKSGTSSERSSARSSTRSYPCREAIRPKHIVTRAMLWDGGYGKTLLPAGSSGPPAALPSPGLEGAQSEVIGAILMLGERIASQSEVIGAIVSG